MYVSGARENLFGGRPGQESTTRGGGGDGEGERNADDRDDDEQHDGACDGGLQAAGATATTTESTPTMRVEAVTGPGRTGRVGEWRGVRREVGSGRAPTRGAVLNCMIFFLSPCAATWSLPRRDRCVGPFASVRSNQLSESCETKFQYVGINK